MAPRVTPLAPGLYDQVVTTSLKTQLERLAHTFSHHTAEVDAEDAHSTIADFLRNYLEENLRICRGSQGIEKQRRIVERVIDIVEQELSDSPQAAGGLPLPLTKLRSIEYAPTTTQNRRPDTPLSRSALLTGTAIDPSLASQLSSELATCDRVDILCSFIKWSGLRILLDVIESLANKPSCDVPRVRVITTSYMGATDLKAIETLEGLPNTEIRVSYDTKRTRLHAGLLPIF